MTTPLTGDSAIEFAESRGLRLSKYADPIEGYRTGLTPDEAREIAKQDPSLIYLEGCPYCGSCEGTVEGDNYHPGYTGWPRCAGCGSC